MSLYKPPADIQGQLVQHIINHMRFPEGAIQRRLENEQQLIIDTIRAYPNDSYAGRFMQKALDCCDTHTVVKFVMAHVMAREQGFDAGNRFNRLLVGQHGNPEFTSICEDIRSENRPDSSARAIKRRDFFKQLGLGVAMASGLLSAGYMAGRTQERMPESWEDLTPSDLAVAGVGTVGVVGGAYVAVRENTCQHVEGFLNALNNGVAFELERQAYREQEKVAGRSGR